MAYVKCLEENDSVITTIREFLKMDIDCDVCDDYTGELDIAFVGPIKLTPAAEERFSEILDFEITITKLDDNLSYMNAYIAIPDDGGDVMDEYLNDLIMLFEFAAGYCKVETYNKYFEEA